MGLQKQLRYARQIQNRIKDIEREFGLPSVTTQVGRPGLVSSAMIWMLRMLCFIDVVVAFFFAFKPDLVQ